ncbi:MAG: DNA polymerase Y family protein [Gammaproteobacteria bacterium]|nr:DNA polymerase Y family protein [Gammaproteobacteria bacterium]
MAVPSTTPGLFQSLPVPAVSPASESLNRAGDQFPHLWLCINLPRLALEVLNDKAVAGPLVVVDGEGSHCLVHAVNETARRQGIHCGSGLNAAYALCPHLQIYRRDLHREHECLEKLALWATRFTPWVHIERPAALLLEVRGSLRLFNGADRLCAQIGTKLEAMHHCRQLALAPTPLAALWLARVGRGVLIMQPQELPGQLGKLPLHCLGWPDKTIASLKGMGIYSVRDCLRLPRDGFARRFGKRYLQQLDRALGRLPDPRPSFVAPDRFRETIEMPAETANTHQLLIAAERLIAQLTGYLIARQAGVQNIGLRLFHSEQSPTVMRVGLLEQCQDSRRLLSLARLRLESLKLPAPVIALQLMSGKVTPLAGRERQLFAYQPGLSCDRPALLENLRTKLGVSAVFSVAGVADHRPESAWCRVEPDLRVSRHANPSVAKRPIFEAEGRAPGWSGGRNLRDLEESENRNLCPRPLWLLSQPQRLSQTAGRPDYAGPLVCETGPERIETGWWDCGDIVRDYYIMRDVQGLRLWVYRERRAPYDWYLHGYFG